MVRHQNKMDMTPPKDRVKYNCREKNGIALNALRSAICLVFLFSSFLCAEQLPITQTPYMVNKKEYYPIPSSKGYQETGIASWYGQPFHGRKTSNGERYNMHEMTAAHKTLPMGTTLLVRNLDNKKETVVRINDRGPFVRGRVIDLSYLAAKKLGIVHRGTTRVQLIALTDQDPGQPHIPYKDLHQGKFFVQVGAFSKKSNALRLQERFKNFGHQTIVRKHKRQSANSLLYRVQVYAGTSLEIAARAEEALIEHGYSGAFVVAH